MSCAEGGMSLSDKGRKAYHRFVVVAVGTGVTQGEEGQSVVLLPSRRSRDGINGGVDVRAW